MITAQALDRYEPVGAARDLFYTRDPEVLIEGPAGTGKTRAVLEKVNAIMCKYPRSRGLISRKTRASMTQTILVTFEEKVLPRNALLYPVTNDVQRRNRQSYVYPNGSELMVVGMDNPDRIMSGEFDVAAFFEGTEGTLDDLEKITTRMRNGVVPYQQVIVDCNPGAPSHFLNLRADEAGKSGSRQMRRLLSRHEHNPLLFDRKAKKWTKIGESYVLGVLEKLTGARHARLRIGKWAQSEGVVYERYDSETHLLTPQNAPSSFLRVVEGGRVSLVLPKDWRRIRTVDFGLTNPFVCQWWAIDPDGRMYLYRELYGTGRIVSVWAKLIKELTGDEKIEATVSDHDREDRETLHSEGIHTIPAMKAISPGIQAVTARLEPALDDRPRLFLLADALHEADQTLIDAKRPLWTGHEFEAYSYPKGTDGKANKEEPTKEHDHGMDAMRYGVAYVDNIGRTEAQVRVVGGGGSISSTPSTTPTRTTERGWKRF